jgi:c-di-GMP-binding flagellar brake protein YcgR
VKQFRQQSEQQSLPRQRPNVAGVLELWDKLELTIEVQGRTGRYHTRVEDITAEHLVVDRPVLIAGDALFSVGTYFSASFFKPDSAYTFTGRIGARQEGRTESYLIPIPTDIERNQRRRYYRLDVTAAVIIMPAEELLAGRASDGEIEQFDAKGIDISGNGLQVHARLDTEASLRVLLLVNLENFSRELSLIGIIRRRVLRTDRMREYGIEFFTSEELPLILKESELRQIPERFRSFNEIQRTTLLNYIFGQQVEMKKKGLI